MAAASSGPTPLPAEPNPPARSLWQYPPEFLALFPGVSKDTIGKIPRWLMEGAAYFTPQATTAAGGLVAPRHPTAVPLRLTPLTERLRWLAELPPVMNIGFQTGHYDAFCLALKATYEPGALSNEDRIRSATISFQIAGENNHPIYLHLLLAKGEIDPVTIRNTFISAAENGCLDVVHTLLAREEITLASIGSALNAAAQNGHLDIVNALLAKEGIPPHIIGVALWSAAIFGHLDVVNALLAKEGIPPHIGVALYSAAKNGHLDVVTALLAREGVTPADIARALSAAAENGHFDVVTALSAMGE